MKKTILTLVICLQFSCQTTPISDDRINLSADVEKTLVEQDVIIIGENHDNPAHHEIQKDVIDYLGSKGLIGAVYMEHLTEEKARLVNQMSPKTLEQFLEITDWQNSGWPDSKIFASLIQTLLDRQVKLVGIGLDRKMVMGIYKGEDLGLIEKAEKKSLGLLEALPKDEQNALLKTIRDSHCNLIPEEQVLKMLAIQRYRDAYMANRHERVPGKISVYLMGSGHANLSRGMPYYLKKAQPKLRVFSIAPLELGRSSFGKDFDLVIATGAITRDDPCQALRQRFAP